MKRLLFLLFTVVTVMGLRAQDNDGQQAPFYVGEIQLVEHVSSMASRMSEIPPATTSEQEMEDGRHTRGKVVIGKDPKEGQGDELAKNPHPLTQSYQGKAPELVFDAYSSYSQPTDPSLAVGPNHVFVVFNTGYKIYDKDGNAMTSQLAPSGIFGLNGCCDLTVSYDNAADRWVASLLTIGSGAYIAVSDGPDPVNAGWNVYHISSINDYQKLSVWGNGYYMTDNTNSSNKVWALERSKMLNGDSSAQMMGFNLPGIVTSGFYSPQAFNVSDDNPSTGDVGIVYMQDDAWSGVSSDHLKLWTLHVDWNTPSNSSISSPQQISLTPFVGVFDGGSFSNLTQPGGGDIDALQATIMNQAQFRKFSDHNSAVFNFVVNAGTSSNEIAAVRWIELRQPNDNGTWSLYQEGTYTAPDNRHAWNASLIMDSQGNIGMGYTSMSSNTSTNSNVHVGSYYTGRYANDAPGTMTIAEETIAAGTSDIPGNRYGDYSKIDVDPSDDKSFWYITEYMHSGRKGVAGKFRIAPNTNNDVGVVSIDSPVSGILGSNETVSVTIFNYGQSAASNFSVSYQIDGGTAVTETFTGTIQPTQTASFTFSQTADLSNVGQTYIITAYTSLSGDEDTTNDSYTTAVTNLQPDDIGVSAIVGPVSGSALGANETITVELTNYGGADQSNFDVSYDVDGNTVTETVTATLPANSSMNYDFAQTYDFSALGAYNVTATTLLAGDVDNSNDSASAVIMHTLCQPQSNCDSFGDAIYHFILNDIDNDSDCGSDGYSNFMDITGHLGQGATYDATFTTGYGDEHIRIWIDFNDDFNLTTDEIVLNDFVVAPGQGQGNYTETTQLTIPSDATLGQHLMRVKMTWNTMVSDDPCADASYGETEDYTVEITPIGIEDVVMQDASLIVTSDDNNIFHVRLLNTATDDQMTLTVHNVMGQKLLEYRLDKENGEYQYTLDMSYADTGVYLVRIGNETGGKIKKIIVE